MPRRDALSIHEEMQKIQEQIGQLQYKLTRLQNELNFQQSKKGMNQYDCPKGDTYISFNNGSEIKGLHAGETVRGKGWFFDIDLAKEE